MVRRQDFHFPGKLKKPTPKNRAYLHIDRSCTPTIRIALHFCTLTELVIYNSYQCFVELKNNLDRFAAVHFESLLGISGNAVPQGDGFFADVFLDDFDRFHPVYPVISGSVVACAVGDQIVVVLIEHKRNGFYDIMVVVPAVNLVAVLIKVVIIENDFLVILKGTFKGIYILIDVLIAVLTGIEAHHVAF